MQDYLALLSATTEEEYRKMKRELETYYRYRLQVINRATRSAYDKRRAQISQKLGE